MYESKWYDHKILEEKVFMFYRLSNRIKALISFLLLIFIFIYYRFEFKNDINFWFELIFWFIVIYLLYMGILVDETIFNNKTKNIYIKKGIFFLNKKKKIPYSSIEEIAIIKHEIGYKKKVVYEFTIHFKNGDKIKFGIFKKKDSLEKIKKVILKSLNIH